jgi:hypothetical protein
MKRFRGNLSVAKPARDDVSEATECRFDLRNRGRIFENESRVERGPFMWHREVGVQMVRNGFEHRQD